jgi:putative inorganic carbon (HCO3(-)) transporter
MTDAPRPALVRLLSWLSGLEWFVVASVAPLLLFPTVRATWTVAALAILIGVWMLRWVVRRQPWPVTPLNLALLLFAAMIPVGIWASALPQLTLPKAAGLILGLSVLRVVALTVRNRRTFGLAVAAFCLLGVGITAVGTMAAQWAAKVPILGALADRIPHVIGSLPELNAEAVSANQLAGALTLYLPLAGTLVGAWPFRRGRSVGRFLLLGACLAFLGIIGGVLLLAQSRSGWIGAGAGALALVTLWGLTGRHRWMRILGAVVPVLTCLGLLGGVFIIGPQQIQDLLTGTGSDASMETVAGSVTLAGRVEIWSRALYAIQDFPFTGCGLGTFRRVVHILYPLFMTSPDSDIAHAHNVFLQTALDLGLPGLVAYVALLGLALVICWRWARRGDRLYRAVSLGLAAGLIGLHAYGLTDAVALGSKPGVAFWMALGLVAVLERVGERRSTDAEPSTSRLLAWVRSHPRPAAVLAAGMVILVGLGAYAGWRALAGDGGLLRPSIRLPIYTEARGLDLRAESPPDNAGWVGVLEVATFTTTHSINDVVAFYDQALDEGGWETDIEAGDETSWGGIYTREGGHSVCLLNVFDIEGEVWISILCGDKEEPVDLPPISPPATPTPGE